MGCKVYVHLMGALKKPCKDPLAKIEVMDLEISNETLDNLLKDIVDLFNITSTQLSLLCLCMLLPSSDPSSTPSLSSPWPGFSCLSSQLFMSKIKLKLMKFLPK